MYATVTRRRQNAARAKETNDRAQREFFPQLRQAPGFVSFTVIAGDDGVNTAISLWESQAALEAFRNSGVLAAWGDTLTSLGHHLEAQSRGEVIQHFGAGAAASVT
jgi:heme-degrading monooxygenase HmoA